MHPSETRGACRILVVQHSGEAPGANFCASLERNKAVLQIVQPFDGDSLPAATDGFQGLVVLGGPQHAADDQGGPHFRQLMALIRAFDREHKPVAGLCLGCQLLARAHGGDILNLGFLEFGFVQHRLTAAGQSDPVTGGGELPPLMEFHQDSFVLPADALLLIEGDSCTNQCFRIGNCSYGFQFHLEIDGPGLNGWLERFGRGEIAAYRQYREQFDQAHLDELASQAPARIRESEQFCDRVAGRWLALTRPDAG